MRILLAFFFIMLDCIVAFGLLRTKPQARALKNAILRGSIFDEISSDLVKDKVIETLEDTFIHLKRYSKYYFNKPSIDTSTAVDSRPVILVIGSGWSAHAFLKIIEADYYRVICISPRSYFIFTPMLTATAVGTVEFRSIIEPIRSANPFIEFIEGEVADIDPYMSEVTIRSTLRKGDAISKLSPPSACDTPLSDAASTYKLSYDYLIDAVGAQTADFGVEGVRQHCCFIKEIDDVRKLKNSILNSFELASSPANTPDQVAALLTWVIVGGGPTGVEFAGAAYFAFYYFCLLIGLRRSLID